VRQREERIVGAVHDQRGRRDPAGIELFAAVVADHQPVVAGRCRVDAAVEDLAGDAADARLVYRDRAREAQLAVDVPVDDLVAVGPVRLGRRVLEPRRERGLRPGQRREVGAPDRGAGHDRERGDEVGTPHRHRLGDRATHRDPDEVRRPRLERLEQSGGVVVEHVAAVRRIAGLAGRRLPRVAVVEAHDAAAARRERLAEVDVPPVHGGRRPRHEQDRRVLGTTELLDAELDVADRDQARLSRGGGHEGADRARCGKSSGRGDASSRDAGKPPLPTGCSPWEAEVRLHTVMKQRQARIS
jgi:hypothetical protein